jgi:TatD DNase family protein
MIHARPAKGTNDAYVDLIDILTSAKKEYGDDLRGNVHFFVGGVEEARKLIELDLTLSFTAVLTFARDYDEVVRFAPLTHILSETDSPYVAPAPNRGRRNDPRAVIAVVEAIAGIRGEDVETVRVQILENAQELFKLP